MGALELNRLCGTCGLKASLCPNHMGHITLETPLYHIMFYDTVRKLLKCMCFHCSKLIVSENTTNPVFKEEINRSVYTQSGTLGEEADIIALFKHNNLY